jgi:hypothetical protein
MYVCSNILVSLFWFFLAISISTLVTRDGFPFVEVFYNPEHVVIIYFIYIGSNVFSLFVLVNCNLHCYSGYHLTPPFIWILDNSVVDRDEI